MLVTRPLFAQSMSIMRPGVQTTISHPARVLTVRRRTSGVPSEHADHSAGRANDNLACRALKATAGVLKGTAGVLRGTLTHRA